MQKNKGIASIAIILIIIAILAVGSIWYLYSTGQIRVNSAFENHIGENVPTPEIPQNKNSGLKEYKNDTLGISFNYPESLGELKTDIKNDRKGFRFYINSSPMLYITGKSIDDQDDGRDIGPEDFTKKYILESSCDKADNTQIVTKNNVQGVFSYTRIASYDPCDDYSMKNQPKYYYAVFDTNTKIQNVLIQGDASRMSKEEFMNIVASLEIK